MKELSKHQHKVLHSDWHCVHIFPPSPHVCAEWGDTGATQLLAEVTVPPPRVVEESVQTGRVLATEGKLKTPAEIALGLKINQKSHCGLNPDISL